MSAYSPQRITQLQAFDRSHLWHPFTQMREYLEPLIIASGEGCELVDIEGKRYLDGFASLWVNVHGHAHPRINAAIREQLERVAHSTLLGFSNVAAVEFAEALLPWLPAGLNKIFYSDSGSTAVEVALKMAFQYWQLKGEKRKTRFVTLEHAYHGDTLGSVSVGGIDLFHQIFQPLLFESLVLKNYDLRALEAYFRRGDIAALIVEPRIQGAAGMFLQPPGFLRGVRELCDVHDVLMIADEVATGFGRTGKMFALEHEGVVPDLMCLAKGISGGYLPLAVTATSERVFEAFLGRYEEFKTFFHGHSYTGNALACAAGRASLGIFSEEKILERLPEKVRRLSQCLKPLQNHPQVREVRQLGLMVGVELMQAGGEPYPVSARAAARVCAAAVRRGALLRPLGDVVVLMPPLAMSEEQLGRLTGILQEALDEELHS